MAKLIGTDDFRAEAMAAHKAVPGQKLSATPVYRVAVGTPKAAGDGSRRIRFVFSDASVDRSGDTIAPDGWQLDAFGENPVALWAHDASALPIGRAVNVLVEAGRLMGDIEFAAAEDYAFADTVYRMVKAGYINAVSVGFMPIDYKWADDEEERPWGIDFTQQELLEISVVPVPCNANALIEARAKGIDTRPLVKWAETMLDGGGKLILPRTEVERLRKAALPPKAGTKQQHAHAGDEPFQPAWLRSLATALHPILRSDGANETDPTSGGAIVPTCGRNIEDDCGLVNPGECAVHGDNDMADDKKTAALVRAGVKAEVRRMIKAGKLRRIKAGDETETDDEKKDEQEDHAANAFDHLDKMAKALSDADDLSNQADDLRADAMEHHAEAVKCIKALGGGDDDDGTDGTDDEKPKPGDDDTEKAAAARLKKRLAALRPQA